MKVSSEGDARYRPTYRERERFALSQVMMTAERSRALEAAASRLLRKRGFRADGRPKREVGSKQCAFERTSFVSIPTNGRSGWRIKKR